MGLEFDDFRWQWLFAYTKFLPFKCFFDRFIVDRFRSFSDINVQTSICVENAELHALRFFLKNYTS